MGELLSGREYTPDELYAAKVLQLAGFDRLLGEPGRGPLYFATGEHWLAKVEAYGAKYEAAALAAGILSGAIRREFNRWPEQADAVPANFSAARQQREAARKRITEISGELSRLVQVSGVYLPDEIVFIPHPSGNIRATIVRALPDGLSYIIDTSFGEVEMEARYFVESTVEPLTSTSVSIDDAEAGAASVGAV